MVYKKTNSRYFSREGNNFQDVSTSKFTLLNQNRPRMMSKAPVTTNSRCFSRKGSNFQDASTSKFTLLNQNRPRIMPSKAPVKTNTRYFSREESNFQDASTSKFTQLDENRPRIMSSEAPVKTNSRYFSREQSNFQVASTSKFTRLNQNRPRIMSSKTPVPVIREVFQVKKKHCRDPRFDDLSGTFYKEQFEEDYSFIDEVKQYEKEALEKELKEVGDDAEEKRKIRYLLQRMKNQETCKKMEKKKREQEELAREEMINTLKSGKRPYMPKKSEIKMKRLVDSFTALKESGKLDKYLEKKRRKLFAKDVKRFHK